MRIAYLIIFIFLVGASTNVIAHPGIGIVIDSRGNIYYTDLKNIYRIDTNGDQTIAVPGVHSHEIALDENDNLYGEHLWYNGEQLDTWGHYVWRLKNNGEIEKVIEPKEGFLSDYGFLRDSSGNMYWVERFTTSKFRKKSRTGEITTIAEGKFGDIRWSYCTKGGIIYFVDLDKLYRLGKDGSFTIIADGLAESGSLMGMLSDKRHHVYGIWADDSDNVYIALLDARKVIRIAPDGSKTTVAISSPPWQPTSGVIDQNGNLWLLEFTLAKSRVRKISKSDWMGKTDTAVPVIMNYAIPAGIAAILIVFISLIVTRTFARKRITEIKNNLP